MTCKFAWKITILILMRILVGYLIYHLVITNIANWKMAHRKFVSFPVTKMVDLSSSFLVNVSKRVKPLRPIFFWAGRFYPLVIQQFAIENSPLVVDLPIENGGFL